MLPAFKAEGVLPKDALEACLPRPKQSTCLNSLKLVVRVFQGGPPKGRQSDGSGRRLIPAARIRTAGSTSPPALDTVALDNAGLQHTACRQRVSWC